MGEAVQTLRSGQRTYVDNTPIQDFALALLLIANAGAFRTAIGAGSSNFNGSYGALTGVPSTFTPSAHGHVQSDVVGLVTLLATLAPLASPDLTGNPTAPTQSAGNNSTRLATTAFVAQAIANVIGSAPGALDTLNELATALGNDPNFATTITTALADKLVKTSNLSDLSNVATARSNLGLIIGTNVQAFSSTLNSWAAITRTAGFDAFVAAPTLANLKTLLTDETTVGWNLLALASPSAIRFLQINADNTVSAQDAATQRTALGLGTGDSPTFTAVTATTGNFTSITQDTKIAPTLLNSWVNFGAGFSTAGYYKDRSGRIYLQGLIKSGTTTPGTSIFILPSGYRPATYRYFAVSSNDTASGVVQIDPSTGSVNFIAGSNASFSLDGVSFRTD